jgi:Ser/Thr protein kinase RdoA (MazF antagonist)
MTEAEIERAYAPAAREALAVFGVEAAELRFVNLSENVTFRVTDARDGAVLVLRLHRPWYHDIAELKSERAWTRALAAAGVGVPKPRCTPAGDDFVSVDIAATGERRWAGLAEWIDGELLSEVLKRETDPAAAAAHFARLGAMMAALHEQASAWTPPAGFKRHALDEEGLMGEAPWWGPFWRHPILSPAESDLLLATRDKIRAALIRYGKAPGAYTLIHADMHPGNVLVAGEQASVIDFDDAGFGWRQYDLAVALVAHMGHRHFTAFQAATIAGYRSVRPIRDEDLALLPMFLLARRLVQLGWLHQRPELPPWPGLERAKDILCAAAADFTAPC